MAKIKVVQDYVDFTYIDESVESRRKKDVGDIFLNQGICTDCGWVVRSKNRHDMATCKCGKCFIDGGSWYIRTSGPIELKTVMFKNLPDEPEGGE